MFFGPERDEWIAIALGARSPAARLLWQAETNTTEQREEFQRHTVEEHLSSLGARPDG